MKKIISVLIICVCFVGSVNAQEGIGKKLEDLTYKWDGQAEKLSTYEGLSQFCTVKPYRDEMIETLKGIHHYDSILYEAISKQARYGGNAEIKKTLKDIEKLETEYSIRDFLTFLHEECNARNDIERNAKKTGDDKDSEVYMLEVELQKYVKHITKRIDVVRDHIHHLNIK